MATIEEWSATYHTILQVCGCGLQVVVGQPSLVNLTGVVVSYVHITKSPCYICSRNSYFAISIEHNAEVFINVNLNLHSSTLHVDASSSCGCLCFSLSLVDSVLVDLGESDNLCVSRSRLTTSNSSDGHTGHNETISSHSTITSCFSSNTNGLQLLQLKLSTSSCAHCCIDTSSIAFVVQDNISIELVRNTQIGVLDFLNNSLAGRSDVTNRIRSCANRHITCFISECCVDGEATEECSSVLVCTLEEIQSTTLHSILSFITIVEILVSTCDGITRHSNANCKP